jgi:hypothetical protein
MEEAQLGRVQSLAVENAFVIGLINPGPDISQKQFLTQAVGLVTDHRMADRCQMHPDLVGPAGLGRYPD